MEKGPPYASIPGPPQGANAALMPVGLYADVHVPGPVILQLRDRGVDILAATEEETNELPDDNLLTLSTSPSRVLITQDIRFRVMAEDWQLTQRPFAGLI